VLLVASVAQAASSTAASSDADAPRRFALVIGHNEGDVGEEDLRYARVDAERMADVLLRLGDVRATDLVSLVDDRDTATTVFAALDELELRLAQVSGPSVLVVYYSGHASQRALHLGRTQVSLRDLDERLQHSHAATRVLILDACRSGSLTRVKGGEAAAPEIDAVGYAVVTASAAGEDAAESEELQGSFFTHALTSAMSGAADDDGDGRVTLTEAYDYAFNHTVRLSTTSSAGVQHPTFRYDLRGRSDLVLTRLDDEQGRVFASARTQMVLFSSGRVVAELAANDTNRFLVVPPGTYTVVARSDTTMFEGELHVERGQTTALNVSTLKASSFARLVRKGHSDRPVVAGLMLGASATLSAVPWAGGLQLQVPLALSWATITPKLDLSWGNAYFLEFYDVTGDIVRQSYTSARIGAVMSATWDASWVSLSAGAGAGLHLVQQYTERDWGSSDIALGLGIAGTIDVAAQVPLPGRWFVEAGSELGVSTVTLVQGSTNVLFSPRLSLGLWL
jgi:uncharacterized caspase-like protein